MIEWVGKPPKARRIMVSKCSNAAVVEGDEIEDSTDKDVLLEGVGSGEGR